MTITATVITIHNPESDAEREVAYRGDLNGAWPARHLAHFMDRHGLRIVGLVGYQQPDFAGSMALHRELNGE